MTVDLNEKYGVSVTYATISRSSFEATGDIFDRKTGREVGVTVTGAGRTIAAAGERAVQNAYAALHKLPR